MIGAVKPHLVQWTGVARRYPPNGRDARFRNTEVLGRRLHSVPARNRRRIRTYTIQQARLSRMHIPI